MKLKICGMKYQDNIVEVASLQPDYLGFIFYDKSARFFNGNIPELPKSIKKVGVFVNATIEDSIEKVNHYNLQAIQLHGNETPEYCKKLNTELVSASHNKNLNQSRQLSGQVDSKLEIIKVFSIKDRFDFSVLKPYEDVCDYYLFDTKGKLPGGNGYAFNWDVLKNYPSTKPYFLSGGIGLENTEEVLSFLGKQESKYCYAIDINSKFEIEAGLKNIELLKEFKSQL